MDINDKVDTDPHGGVMVSLLASSAVDHGFEPLLSQTIYYKLGICCCSVNHTSLRS